MTFWERTAAYFRQTGRKRLTPRQLRRRTKKGWRELIAAA